MKLVKTKKVYMPQDSIPAEYTYDPLNKKFNAIEFLMPNVNDNYLVNQRLAYEIDTAGVVYHSALYENEIEVSGFFELKAFIETDVKDVDIMANIKEREIDKTGRNQFVSF